MEEAFGPDYPYTWAQGLPVTNTKAVVQQLRLAISELNRTAVAPDIRFAVMEVLRPNLLIALVSLSRKYLNQPLVLPEESRQQSELASSLLALTTTAYTVCAVQAIQKRDSISSVNPARLVCESLRRAIEFSGRKILQAYQLYQPVEPNTWLELHQLYALAERQQLANIPVADKLSGDQLRQGRPSRIQHPGTYRHCPGQHVYAQLCPGRNSQRTLGYPGPEQCPLLHRRGALL